MRIGPLARLTRAEVGGTAEVDRLKRALVLEQKGGEDYGFGPGQRVRCYREVANWFEVPRQWAVRKFGGLEVEEATTEGEAAPFQFTADLRPYQKPLVTDFLDALDEPRNRYGGILSAPCGRGKTVMAAWLLSQLGRKAVVLVHAGFLMEQWRDTFLNLTDLTEDDLGLVQQATCEWEGKKVVMAMVESLVGQRDYPQEMFDSFGVVVCDEVHRHGAVEWSKAAAMFPARTRIGLSATPRRGDGLWNVIEWHVGDVLVKEEGGGDATVFQVETGVALPRDVYEGRGRAKINLARLINALTRIGSRNDLIVDEVIRAVKAGRRPLVLSHRLEHLDTLSAMFELLWDGDHPDSDETRTANAVMGKEDSDDFLVGKYVGGMKKAQIERSRKCRVVFGTYQYAKEGLDDPSLDTLFFATPASDIEQAAGRILRDHPDKKNPLIVDPVDEKTGPCVGFARRRSSQYKRLGFTTHRTTPTGKSP